jgi:hypothetical protein
MVSLVWQKVGHVMSAVDPFDDDSRDESVGRFQPCMWHASHLPAQRRVFPDRSAESDREAEKQLALIRKLSVRIRDGRFPGKR